MHDVVLFGASGYAGLELLRLLARHPETRVRVASASTLAGQPVRHFVPEWPTALTFTGHEAALEAARAPGVALLATPAKTSTELAPKLLERGLSVVDVSGAFRLDRPEEVEAWYGFQHPRPDLLPQARYGLVELFPPGPPASSPALVANPGCYATAAILAAAPLVTAGLVEPGAALVIDGKSGATGAGRTLDEKLLFSEVAESMRPYRIAKHQHTPEIERALRLASGREVRVAFTAHLVPMRRGLLASVYAPAAPGVTLEKVREAFRGAYAKAPFIRLLEDRPPETGLLTGTNFTEVFATYDARARVVSAYAALDNLVKGAAGQAIQNLNAVLGLPLETGLLPSKDDSSR